MGENNNILKLYIFIIYMIKSILWYISIYKNKINIRFHDDEKDYDNKGENDMEKRSWYDWEVIIKQYGQ